MFCCVTGRFKSCSLPTGGFGGLPHRGGRALRVPQIGCKLRFRPYGPEQKCNNFTDLGPPAIFPHSVGLGLAATMVKR